jgi:hypothetical protein
MDFEGTKAGVGNEAIVAGVLSAQDLDTFSTALSLLENASDRDSDPYKDAVYCLTRVQNIKAGIWCSDVDFRLIDNKKIASKLRELQFVFRIELSKTIEEVNDIVAEQGQLINGRKMFDALSCKIAYLESKKPKINPIPQAQDGDTEDKSIDVMQHGE